LHIKDVNGYPFYMKKQIFNSLKVKEKNYLFNLDLLHEIRKNKYVVKMAYGFFKYSIGC